MNRRLLDVLVCPSCKGPLRLDEKTQELICRPDQMAFPIRDGIPIMWTAEARSIASGATNSN